MMTSFDLVFTNLQLKGSLYRHKCPPNFVFLALTGAEITSDLYLPPPPSRARNFQTLSKGCARSHKIPKRYYNLTKKTHWINVITYLCNLQSLCKPIHQTSYRCIQLLQEMGYHDGSIICLFPSSTAEYEIDSSDMIQSNPNPLGTDPDPVQSVSQRQSVNQSSPIQAYLQIKEDVKLIQLARGEW